MSDNLNKTILRSLLTNEEYLRKVVPFLKPNYFEGPLKLIFKQIAAFVEKHNTLPTLEAFRIDLEQNEKISDDMFTEVSAMLPEIFSPVDIDPDFLLEKTENWCQERALHIAIMESINILDGKNEKMTKNAIPELLSEALGVGFDNNIGHDYIDNAEDRYDFYNRVEEKIPFDIELLNIITKGGLPDKTLNIILAGCVHPNTKVKIRYRKKLMNNDLEWSKPKEYPISQIQTLLENGYEVEVESPDGYIPVNYFINKGMHQEYVLKVDDVDIDPISCNGEHLFETSLGWYSAKQLSTVKEEVNILTKNGYKKGIVSTTDETIPIVDINVEHKNHRYYTNNVSSHNTGVGKSLGMCHIAASSLLQGKNVLYITMEMAEERIAERIDANLLDIPIDQLDKMPKTMFTEKVNNLAKKTVGKLIVKEYPTGAAHAGHFRALLKELKLKKSFIPDIIFIDYLNICASSRMKSMGGAINSYTYIKAIAEELRGIAVEFAVPVVSATQTTRSGFSNSDPGLEDTSESFGLPATADLMLAFVSNEELEQSGQIMIKQLKNRYNDPNKNKRFVVGIDRSKMRLYDVEATDQTLVDDGIPVFDKTPSGDKFKDFKI